MCLYVFALYKCTLFYILTYMALRYMYKQPRLHTPARYVGFEIITIMCMMEPDKMRSATAGDAVGNLSACNEATQYDD